ncbi:UBP-type zinc finger domain-containing protein [Rhodococcus aerolatus]
MSLFRRSRPAPDRTPAPPAGGCEHLAAAPAAEPDPVADPRCEDCTALGEDLWAHLRQCLECGHVACCDSSPHRHATAHHHGTGHPVMRSVEPGETWRWCYPDALLG